MRDQSTSSNQSPLSVFPGFQREIAVLMQPGIQIDAASERLEAVVGDDHQQGLVVDLLHDAADQFVHARVEILNHLRTLIARHIARGRMIVVEVAPEHVLHAVGGVEDAGAQALLRFLERVEQHALAIVVIGVALREEGVVVENMFVQGPGVFGEAERRVGPEEFRQINGIRDGMRDGQIGLAGIDVHRRHVDFDFGRKFLEIEAADAVRAEAHAGLELHGNPLGVFADLQREFLAVDREARWLLPSVGTNFEIRRAVRRRNCRSADPPGRERRT